MLLFQSSLHPIPLSKIEDEPFRCVQAQTIPFYVRCPKRAGCLLQHVYVPKKPAKQDKSVEVRLRWFSSCFSRVQTLWSVLTQSKLQVGKGNGKRNSIVGGILWKMVAHWAAYRSRRVVLLAYFGPAGIAMQVQPDS